MCLSLRSALFYPLNYEGNMKKESLGLRLGDCSEDRTKYKSLCKCPSIKSKCKKRVIVGISKDIFCRKSELCFFGLENGHLDVLTISKGSDLLDLDIVDHPRDGIVSKMRSIRDMVDSSYEEAAALVRELEGKSRPFDEARVLVKYYLRMLFDHTRSGDPLGRCIEVNVELWSHRYRLDLYFGILKNESQKKIAIYGEVWWNIYMIPTSKLQEILDTAD